MLDDLVFGMAGSGGGGVVAAGEAQIAAAAAEGYHAIMTKSFGSQIRGGESSRRVRVSTRPIGTSNGPLYVAIGRDDSLELGAELQIEGTTVVIYEAKTGVARLAAMEPGRAPAAASSTRASSSGARRRRRTRRSCARGSALSAEHPSPGRVLDALLQK